MIVIIFSFFFLLSAGGEGAESCVPFYREIFKLATAHDVDHLFVCMAHRGSCMGLRLMLFITKPYIFALRFHYTTYAIGRLNLLTGMLNCPNELMFSKMKGRNELPSGTKGCINDDEAHYFMLNNSL